MRETGVIMKNAASHLPEISMRRASRIITLAILATAAGGCTDLTPPAPATTAGIAALDPSALSAVREEGWEGGAIVLNSGEGQPTPTCFFRGTFFTTQASVARSPSGNWTLSCSFDGLPAITEQESSTGWLCSIIGDPSAQTHHSSWVRSPSGSAHLSCHFSDKPIQDAVVSFGDVVAAAQQGAFTTALAAAAGQAVSGETVNVGLGCSAISADLSGKIAVAERGVCAFSDKARNALDAGAAGIVVYNSAPFGDQIIVMGGLSPVDIPAVFVGRSTGLALLATTPTQVTITYCNRSASCRGQL
jgi:hypothetical protein